MTWRCPTPESTVPWRWLLVLLLSACNTPMRVTVVGAGAKVRSTPRPSGCSIQVFAAAPAAPFDELGTLHLETAKNAPDRALEAMRDKACALGADAMVIIQPYAQTGDSAAMTATAIRYRGTRTDPLHPVPSNL
jgi:hypothetical protein